MSNNNNDETLNPDEDKTLSDYSVPKREACMVSNDKKRSVELWAL